LVKASSKSEIVEKRIAGVDISIGQKYAVYFELRFDFKYKYYIFAAQFIQIK
jgi:hypothetical protein